MSTKVLSREYANAFEHMYNKINTISSDLMSNVIDSANDPDNSTCAIIESSAINRTSTLKLID